MSPLEIVSGIFATFANYFEFMDDFTKYLKEGC